MAAAMGIPILANEIAQRVAYAESLTMGKMIFEWAPESAELRHLIEAHILELESEIGSVGQDDLFSQFVQVQRHELLDLENVDPVSYPFVISQSFAAALDHRLTGETS